MVTDKKTTYHPLELTAGRMYAAKHGVSVIQNENFDKDLSNIVSVELIKSDTAVAQNKFISNVFSAYKEIVRDAKFNNSNIVIIDNIKADSSSASVSYNLY